MERFDQYKRGLSLFRETDHSPLVTLRIRLMRYQYVHYVHGKLLKTADTLSRALLEHSYRTLDDVGLFDGEVVKGVDTFAVSCLDRICQCQAEHSVFTGLLRFC